VGAGENYGHRFNFSRNTIIFSGSRLCAVAQYENECVLQPKRCSTTHKGDLETLEIFISARSKQAPTARAELHKSYPPGSLSCNYNRSKITDKGGVTTEKRIGDRSGLFGPAKGFFGPVKGLFGPVKGSFGPVRGLFGTDNSFSGTTSFFLTAKQKLGTDNKITLNQ
jgi:hypothetical protein